MSPAKSSGISLSKDDLAIVLGMEARGDRNHDIAAWFGVNQGRIAEAKDGKFGTVTAAPTSALPPKGPPGIKGRRMRAAADKVRDLLASGSTDTKAALKMIETAIAEYDSHER